MRKNYELRLLVNGKYATTYNANGDQYLEGRPGSVYEIELRNNTNTDVEFVVSVDGMSITDGKAAGSKSIGYIVNAWGSARIKGWKLNKESAAEFKFGAKSKSYAALSDEGSVENTGVIGLQVFPRKYVAPVQTTYMQYVHNPNIDQWYNQPTLSAAIPKGLDTLRSVNTMQLNASSTVGMAACGTTTQNFTSSVGTEFGDQTDFHTTTVSFERASLNAAYQEVIYYGDAKDLNKLGIVLDWQHQERVKPQAFPADGCTPPANWTPRSK